MPHSEGRFPIPLQSHVTGDGSFVTMSHGDRSAVRKCHIGVRTLCDIRLFWWLRSLTPMCHFTSSCWSAARGQRHSLPCHHSCGSVLGFCKPLKHSEKQIYPRVERYKKVQLWILTARHDFGVCATLKSQIIFNNSLRLFNRWILAILSVCQLQWAKRECFLSVKRGRQNDRNRVFCTAVVSWML